MSAIILLLGALAVFIAARRLSGVEQRYIMVLFVAHVLSANAILWLFEEYYGYGDIEHYVIYGRLLAHCLDVDFARFFPQVLKVASHMDNELPFQGLSGASSTGTLCAITGLIMFVVGPTKLAACLVISIFSMLGQLSIYKVVREVLPRSEHILALVGTLLVPSVVFWSSGIQKEAVAVGFLGILCWGAFHLARGRVVAGFVAAAIGAIGIGLVKGYILFPFVLASGAAIFTAQGGNQRWTVRGFAYAGVAACLAVGGIVLLGKLFPSFSPEAIGETAAHLQSAGASVRMANDSYVAVGDASDSSLSGQAPYLPLALFNALFRPLLLEVRSLMVLVAALEMAPVGALMVIILFRARRQATRDIIRTSPILVFCLVFAIAFGTGVGIATTNMGTLSRYRIPMMPFYVTALLLIHRRSSPGALAAREEGEAEAEHEEPETPTA